MKEQISDAESRILADAFFDNVNYKKLNKAGYREYLWNQWKALWKNKEIVDKLPNGKTVTRVVDVSEEAKLEFMNAINDALDLI